jgi:hypothetical protein
MFNRTNLAESRLASGISSAATGFSLTTGEGQYFPASNFLIGCYPADYVSPAAAKKAGKHEWMIVGTRTVDALSSITRAALGSTALDFNESGKQYVVYNPVVAEELLGFNRLFADAGGDDDYVVSTGFALASLTAFDELVIQLKVATPNTSTPTLAFDSVAAKSIKTMTASGLINAPNYSMIAGGRYFLQWSQADDCWVLLNPSTPAKLTGNVLPTFVAATHPVGTEFLLIPESVADEAARLVTGTPLRYVYQVDTGITYKCTSEDGDEANDWTAVGTGLLSVTYQSNGVGFRREPFETLLSQSFIFNSGSSIATNDFGRIVGDIGAIHSVEIGSRIIICAGEQIGGYYKNIFDVVVPMGEVAVKCINASTGEYGVYVDATLIDGTNFLMIDHEPGETIAVVSIIIQK